MGSKRVSRRVILKLTGAGVAVSFISPLFNLGKAMAMEKTITPLILSEKEWDEKLTDQQYDILREEGTERPFTTDLLDEHRSGVYACVGCDLPLFKSEYKYNSGTGWPSFFDAIPEHVETKIDYKLIAPRTEYHCARCGGHHGHVFKDGPKPTGLRYCNNGAVLKFIPDEA